MSLLTEKPPVSVEIGGMEVPVNADFRVMLRIDGLRGGDLSEAERGMEALRLFYGQVPADIAGATERMLWFLRCGEAEKMGEGGTPSRPDFSFAFDAPLICAAFRGQYGVDLVDIGFLHWWEFRALFDGLRHDHLFCEIRRVRAMDLGKIKDKEQRRYYSRMKKLYALPLPDDQKEQLDAITDALMNGGDVGALLGAY